MLSNSRCRLPLVENCGVKGRQVCLPTCISGELGNWSDITPRKHELLIVNFTF